MSENNHFGIETSPLFSDRPEHDLVVAEGEKKKKKPPTKRKPKHKTAPLNFQKMYYQLRFGIECVVMPWIFREYREVGAQIEMYQTVPLLSAISQDKGGFGKTAYQLHMAARAKARGVGSVLVIDSNENGGSVASRCGLHPGEAPILKEFLDSGTKMSASALMGYMGVHPETKIFIMASPQARDPNNPIRWGQYMEELPRLAEKFLWIFPDPGNGLDDYSNVVPIQLATNFSVVVLHNPDEEVSEDEETVMRIKKSLKHYSNYQREIRVPIEDASVIVVGAKTKHKKIYAELCEWPEDQVFVIPFDKAMARTAFGSLQPHRLRLKTRVALDKDLLHKLRYAAKNQDVATPSGLISIDQTDKISNSSELQEQEVVK